MRQSGAIRAIGSLFVVTVSLLGAEAIELHVFGHNQAAQALYEKLDYETTKIIMAKNLARS